MHIAIIIITVAISLICFNNYALFERLQLRPYVMVRQRQWDRIISHGFVHGSIAHLVINMFVLLSFGGVVFETFKYLQSAGGMNANLNFNLLYFGGLIAALIYDVIRYRNNPAFASIGASGAVAAVVFASILYYPTGEILLFFIIPMPSWVFGLLYIVYESYSARHQRDHINHHAHIFGAVFGFLYPVMIGGTGMFRHFLAQLGLW